MAYQYDENGGPAAKRLEYYHNDHLGNIRLAFSDLDGDGAITVGDIYDPNNEITQERHYYPFGLTHDGPWFATVAPDNAYRYNGKELDEATGLYDYGARWYDPAVARWGQVDPLAEQYAPYSPYNYALNNPISLFDPDGRSVESTIVRDNEDGTYTVTGGNASDGDNGIYVGSVDGEKIGESSTALSFFIESGSSYEPVRGAVIDLSSTEGQDFIDSEIVGANEGQGVGLGNYVKNAKGGEPLDFKSRGMDEREEGLTPNQHRYRGSVASDGTIGSARDFGNVAAGIVAGRNGLSWKASRIGFDALETVQKLSWDNLRPSTESRVSVLSEYRGFLIGKSLIGVTVPPPTP